jgi:hypothetical protein
MTARVKTTLLVGLLAATALATRAATQSDRIPGRTPAPVAEGRARAVGRLDSKQMLRLTLVLQPPNQDELRQFLRDVQDRDSPRFHQYLTFDQWKARFAPTNGEVARVQAWARRIGLNPVHVFRNNLAVKVESDVETIEAAFGVRLNHYEYGPRRFFANDRDPVMPSELAGVLKNVQGLNNFERVRPVSQSAMAPTADDPIYRGGPFIREAATQRSAQRTSGGTEAAGDMAAAAGAEPQICCGAAGIEPGDVFSSDGYDLAGLQRFSACCNPTHNAGGSPKETSIAVIGAHSVADSDLRTFVQNYNMAMNVTQIMIDGAGCCNDEMTMDIEYATAFANSFGASIDTAHVYAYEAGGKSLSDILDAWEEADSADMARNATTSFGAYEDLYGGLGNPSISDYTDVINAMAAKGWAIAAASGDHGATDDCATFSVGFPASSPNLVAAGGTTLVLTNNGGVPQFQSEGAWNGPGCGGTDWPGQNLGGGGGGCASVEPRPFWQELLPSFCGQKRAVPDVSLNAGTGQRLFYGNNGGWISVGGTSIVAPELSGFFAQVNSYLLKLGNICGPSPYTQACVPFGNPASFFWRLGYGGGPSSNGHNPFYDITSGCNGGQNMQGYCAQTGYDLATGWGSFNMLQMAWAMIDAVTAKTNPEVKFTGPAVNTWFNSSKTIDFTIVSDPPTGSSATVKVAGYTAGWDNAIADVTSHATPGSGDSFYTGPATTGSTGSLSLSSGNEGCHTAHVRGWDNSGRTTSDSTYGPVCFDNKPPTVNCGVASPSWFANDVSIGCTALDQTGLSGLADGSPSFFYLSTSVAAGTENPNAYTDSREVCDKAGNCVTAGPIGLNKIDKRAPSIAIAAPTATEYIVAQPVAADYSCEDAGSGVATCAGPVAKGANIDTASVGTKTFAVNATDNVANASSLSTTYTVTYRICLQYDPNTPMSGRGLNISLQLCDFNNANVSKQSIAVTALAVDGSAAKARALGSLNPGNVFLYGPAGSPGASYLYVLDSQGLGAGPHVLTFSVAGDPVTHSAPFRIKK